MRIWRGVTLQLFLVAVLPLTLLLLVVTFGSLSLHHGAMRALVADRNLRAVQSAAVSVSKEIDHRGQTLALFAKDIGTDADLSARLASDLAVFEGGVAAVGTGGEASFIGGEAIRQLAASDEWREILSEAPSPTASQAIFLPARPVSGQMYVPTVAVGPEGEILIGLFSPAPLLTDGLAFLSIEEPVTVLVLDKEYHVLYRSGSISPEEDLATHPGIAPALAGSSGIDYLDTSEGEHVITTSYIASTGWALMLEESWEDIASPLLRATQNAPLIIIPVLGLSLLAIWFGLRQIVQPMQDLEGKAVDLARGNFETIRQPVGGVPEIRHLQDTLVDMAAQLKQAQDSLHNYIGAITDSVEADRRSLARELHDETLQSLIALGQYTQYAAHWNQDPKVAKTLDQVLELSEQSMKNLRRLVQGLRPIYIEDLGLATALAMQAGSSESPDGVKIHFEQIGEERRLKPEVEMALYRITQEALSNVHRHSDARNAWISLHFRSGGVVLEIRDDGRGFELPPDPIYFARMGHYGLLSLYERSELIGAKLTIRSSADEGTQILVRLADDLPPTSAV